MEGGAHSYRIKNFITMASRKRFLAFDSSEDDTQPTTFTFKANENFAKFLVISSKEDKPITSLSPFIIEKQIESIIGTPKNVKKLKNGTLLVASINKISIHPSQNSSQTQPTKTSGSQQRSMKTAVRKHLDQYVKNVVWVNLITLQMLVKMKPSV